jgi:hypothetical protein
VGLTSDAICAVEDVLMWLSKWQSSNRGMFVGVWTRLIIMELMFDASQAAEDVPIKLSKRMRSNSGPVGHYPLSSLPWPSTIMYETIA